MSVSWPYLAPNSSYVRSQKDIQHSFLSATLVFRSTQLELPPGLPSHPP